MNQPRPARHRTPALATLVILAIMTAFLLTLTGCEILDNIGAGTGAGAGTAAESPTLPAVDVILREARRLDHSPFDVLDRRHKLKKAAISTGYRKRISTVEAKKTAGSITIELADSNIALLKLQLKQALAELQSVYTQRQTELKAQKELFNQ